jgi:hypothetical protein
VWFSEREAERDAADQRARGKGGDDAHAAQARCKASTASIARSSRTADTHEVLLGQRVFVRVRIPSIGRAR